MEDEDKLEGFLMHGFIVLAAVALFLFILFSHIDQIFKPIVRSYACLLLHDKKSIKQINDS